MIAEAADSIYISFKLTVHLGDFKNKRLPLDLCYLMVPSIMSAVVRTSPV